MKIKELIEKLEKLDEDESLSAIDLIEIAISEDGDEYRDLEDHIMGEPEDADMEETGVIPWLPVDGNGNKWPYKPITPHPTPYWSHNPCDGCSNNPVNGGSGICYCTVPYITYTSSWSDQC